MKIFEKRPLALILCIMLGGFSFFADFGWKVKLIAASLSLFAIFAIYIFNNLKQGRKPIVIISLASFCASMLLSALWACTFFPSKYYDENVEIEAKVYDIDNSSSSSTVLICKTEKISGKTDRHTMIAYVDKETSIYIRKYDVIVFTADLNELASYDDGFDGRSYYISKGYSATLDNFDNLEIKENKVDKLDAFFKELRLNISNKLKLRTDFQTGAFLSALIIGERSDLSGSTKLNFARLGISHILALSGMHLAILSLAVNSVFVKLGIKKKIRATIMIALILFYMALTGFSASVLRAGMMLIIYYLLFLLSRKSDSLTSLVIATSLIVALNPTAVYALSLWLSAFATLGVIVFAEIAEKPNKDDVKVKKAWIWLKNGCLVSVFAFCATFVFTALRFDNFSVVSTFTTLLFSFVIQLFIYGGMLLLIVGAFIPFGRIMIVFSNGILWLAEKISSLKFVYVSMNAFVVKLLIVLLTVFFFAFLVMEIKSKKKAVAIILIMLLSVFIASEVHTVSKAYDDDVIYAPSASGDTLILKSDGDITAIYSGKAFMDNAWDILDVLVDENVVYIDNLVFASYSYSTLDFTSIVISGIKVERILLPRPNTKDEINQAEGLSYLLMDFGTKLEFYEMLDYVTFGEYKYRLIDKVDYVYGKYPSNVYEVSFGSESFTYVSVCEYDNLSVSAKALLFNSENLLIGTVGNSNYYLFNMHLPKIRNIYYFDAGRLTDDAMNYYKEKGASVKLTKTPLSIFD